MRLKGRRITINNGRENIVVKSNCSKSENIKFLGDIELARSIYKTTGKKFTLRCQELGYTYKLGLSHGVYGFRIAVSPDGKSILIRTGHGLNAAEYMLSVPEILNIELRVGESVVYRAGPITTLGAAALGGLAFGEGGAIVGALAAGKIGDNSKVSSVDLIFRINNPENPTVIIPFLKNFTGVPYDMSELEEEEATESLRKIASDGFSAGELVKLIEGWVNLVEVYRYRLAQRAKKEDSAVAT